MGPDPASECTFGAFVQLAVSFADGPARALAAVEQIGEDPLLASYAYLAATHADLLWRLERTAEAIAAYDEVLCLTDNTTEAAFLTNRLRELKSQVAAQEEIS